MITILCALITLFSPFQLYSSPNERLLSGADQLAKPTDESIYLIEQKRYFHSSISQGMDELHAEALTLLPPTPDLLRKQIHILQESLEKASTSLTVDETLRWQIWSLGESLKMAKNLNSLSTTQEEEAYSTLEEALSTYARVKKEIAHSLRQEREPLIRELALLAEESDQLAEYAEEFENRLGIRPWPKDKERCASTARAVLLYYAKKHRFDKDLKEVIPPPTARVRALKREILAHANSEENWLYLADSIRFDHVFIIVQSQTHFRVLQSFVGNYSLAAEIAESKEMTLSELLAFMDKLEKIDQSEEWNDEIDALFEEIFYARAPRPITREFSKKSPDLRYSSLPLLQS